MREVFLKSILKNSKQGIRMGVPKKHHLIFEQSLRGSFLIDQRIFDLVQFFICVIHRLDITAGPVVRIPSTVMCLAVLLF